MAILKWNKRTKSIEFKIFSKWISIFFGGLILWWKSCKIYTNATHGYELSLPGICLTVFKPVFSNNTKGE